MPLVENFPNFVMLDRIDSVSMIRDAFYSNKDSWQQRPGLSFFAGCGWYKFPYCSFVPWYKKLNTAEVIGTGSAELANAALPFIEDACSAISDVTGQDMLPWGAELNLIYAGHVVPKHFDRHFYSDYTTRCHLVIDTDPDVVFLFENSRHVFQTGDMFLFNNKLEHGIVNGSQVDRLHLVMDFVPANVFAYAERSIAPFGGHEGTRHILTYLTEGTPLYNEFIAHVKGTKHIVPRKSVELLNSTRADRIQ
jgi:hypothetical protein